MIAIPEGFRNHIGEKMPLPPDMNDFKATEFPHFQVFVELHLNQPLQSLDILAHNAEVIGKLSEHDVKNITFLGLIDLGLKVPAHRN